MINKGRMRSLHSPRWITITIPIMQRRGCEISSPTIPCIQRRTSRAPEAGRRETVVAKPPALCGEWFYLRVRENYWKHPPTQVGELRLRERFERRPDLLRLAWAFVYSSAFFSKARLLGDY